MSRSILLGFAVTAITACAEAVSPIDQVTSRLELPASMFSPGATVLLRVIAVNHGSRQVVAGAGCGEGLDVEVRAPDGTNMFLVRGLPSICPVFDSNLLEPGETDTVLVRWTVPLARGSYTLRGGVQLRLGLGAPSAAASVVVK